MLLLHFSAEFPTHARVICMLACSATLNPFPSFTEFCLFGCGGSRNNTLLPAEVMHHADRPCVFLRSGSVISSQIYSVGTEHMGVLGSCLAVPSHLRCRVFYVAQNAPHVGATVRTMSSMLRPSRVASRRSSHVLQFGDRYGFVHSFHHEYASPFAFTTQ